MEMSFSQYCRIESAAGGVACSEREFIRAAIGRIDETKRGKDWRALRHEWLRSGLKQRVAARGLYRAVMS